MFYFFCRPAFLVLQQAKLFYKKKTRECLEDTLFLCPTGSSACRKAKNKKSGKKKALKKKTTGA
jgi:hypothetical protein